MARFQLVVTSSLILLSSNIVFVSSDCDPEESGLQYGQHEDECLVGGYEKFIQQYKKKNSLNVRDAIKNFQCKLCDPSQYLDCYTNRSRDDPMFETGTCQCISTHSKGYILVYDDTAKECRGSSGSICNRGKPCHEKLICEFGTCVCGKGSTDCDKAPLALDFPDFSASGGVVFTASYKISFIIIIKCLHRISLLKL
ncbi:hypothetical protein Ocin01_08526 [Orchesella cincta]|uniref:EGF-like domain-containing protein n=1 Tax=Orchesella cincta TaxID=48709 RepID=A0A1D2MYM7_ORCCI|nr:hypothetical protein Ocin01_08526 [Orchesella cincta]